MASRRTYLRTLAVGTVLPLVAGCSSDGDTATTPETTATDTTTPSPTDTATSMADTATATPAPTDTGTATDTATATPTDTATETPTSTPTPTPQSAQQAYPDYNWGQLDDATPEVTTTVTLVDFSFDPLIAKVPPGATVTYRNEDSAPHSVAIPKRDFDESVGSGGTVTATFPETGTYDYVCGVHPPDMVGRVVVEEGVSTPTATPTATPTPTPDDDTTTTDDGY
jgi:plastocyanin